MRGYDAARHNSATPVRERSLARSPSRSDTSYADMSHLLEYESRPEQVKGLAYFAAPYWRAGPARPVDRQAHQEANDQVRRNALRFRSTGCPTCCPGPSTATRPASAGTCSPTPGTGSGRSG